MRKSLVFALIAVLSALLVFTSCSNGTTDVQYITDPIGGIADARPAGTEAQLQQLLADDTDDKPIVFSVGQNVTLDSVTWIPPGKTVYIKPVDHSTGGTLTPKAGEGLSVAGTLIVTGNAELKALANNRVHLVSGGALKIENLGALATETRADVDNYPDNLASMLSRASYAGGSTLSITNEILKIDEIQQLLGLITPAAGKAAVAPAGASKLVLGRPQPFMPSELAVIPGLSGERYLQVTANVQETETTLTIPAGIAITVPAEKPLPVTNLTVNGQFEVPAGALNVLTSLDVRGSGSLAAPGNTLPALKELTVSGTLDAPAATGDTTAGITINVAAGGTVTVGTVKPAEGSIVANGGKFSGDTGTTGIPTEKGALINGEESTGGSMVILAAIPTTPLAEGTSQLKPGVYTLAAGLNIPAGATLSLPTGTTLTIRPAGGGTAVAVAVSGTLKIAQGSKVTVGASGNLTKDPATGIIKNEGTLAFEADSADTLNGTTTPAALGAIGKVKALGNDVSGAFVQLTPAFYTANTTTAVTIPAVVVVAPAVDPAVPAVIKGTPGQVLSVGIKIARPYVTLDDVAIKVTDGSKAIEYFTNYPVAVQIAASNVTLKNSTIEFVASAVKPANTGVIARSDPSGLLTNVHIIDNTIRITAYKESAGHALQVFGKDDVTVTGNTITADRSSDAKVNKEDDYWWKAPATALYINRVVADKFASIGDNYKGNKLNGFNFDFYIHADETVVNEGVFDEAYKFSTKDTVFIKSAPHGIKKLIDHLVANSTFTNPNGGFGIAFDFKTPNSMTGPGKELYKITNNAITNISYWTDTDTWGSLDVKGSTFTPSLAGFYIERTVNRSPDSSKTVSGTTAVKTAE